jgi:hypothetical protein
MHLDRRGADLPLLREVEQQPPYVALAELGGRTHVVGYEAPRAAHVLLTRRRGILAATTSASSIAFSCSAPPRLPTGVSDPAESPSALRHEVSNIHPDVSNNGAEKRGGNVAPRVKGYRRSPTIGVAILAMRPALANLRESEALENRCNL